MDHAMAVLERPTSTPLATFAGCDVVVIPRTAHDHGRDPRVAEALELERTIMTMLGDEPGRLEADIDETLEQSSFAVAYDHADHRRLLGAVRFMTGECSGVKTLWDVRRASPDGAMPLRHPWIDRPHQLVDALSLAPSLDAGLSAVEATDLLIDVCHLLGAALFHSGRSRYVTGDLHGRFLGHLARFGYDFQPLVEPGHPAWDAFVPVVGSLAAIDELARQAPPGSPAALLGDEYDRVCAVAATLGTEDW